MSAQLGRALAQDHSPREQTSREQTSREQTQEDPAQNVARAEEYASQAFDAYSQQDYPRAVALYQQALAASASPDIIYNLARIYDLKLKDRALSIEFYERYTADPGAD